MVQKNNQHVLGEKERTAITTPQRNFPSQKGGELGLEGSSCSEDKPAGQRPEVVWDNEKRQEEGKGRHALGFLSLSWGRSLQTHYVLKIPRTQRGRREGENPYVRGDRDPHEDHII